MPAGESKAARFAAKPLTPDRWGDLEKIFGSSGGFSGCWCMYWRLPRAEFEGPDRKNNKTKFKKRVTKGPPPGLIAYAGREPVGWIQVGPRAGTPNWNGARRLSAPLAEHEAADGKVWGVTCFVVRAGWRGKGVASALVEAAAKWAKKNGARILDACPVEVSEKKPNISLYHGIASTFAKAGFVEIARRRDDRPLMRLNLA